MPKTAPVVTTADSAAEAEARKLSSISERLEELKARDGKVRQTLFAMLKAAGAKNLATIYGNLVIKETKVYNYDGCPEVMAAQEALEVAKAALTVAQKAAQATAPYEVKEALVFTRNKAVSARAKKGRIYIRSFFRRLSQVA